MESSLHSLSGSGVVSSAGDRLAAELARLQNSTEGQTFEATLAATTGSALETVAAMRRGRPASPRLFSGSGPIVAKSASGTQSRSGSTPGTSRALGVSSKGVQDSAVLAAVRRQMEALEDKLSGQIGRVQQQSDRLRDAALSRVDSKMVTIEALQPKLDRRLAELSGNYKGLSDEMQAQIRRLDQMDSRLWEWRHHLEEEVRNKFVEIEQNIQRVSSSMRVMTTTNDDVLKRHSQRVQRLEGLVEERVQSSEDTQSGLQNLHERLEQVEQNRFEDLALVPIGAAGSRSGVESLALATVDSASLMGVETRVSDAYSKLDALMEESRDANTRLEAQEERLKSLHTRVDSREEHYRWLNDRVERTDWEGRFKEIQLHMQEIDQGRVKQSEDIECMLKKLETGDQATEECVEQIRRLYMERQLFNAETSSQNELSDSMQAGVATEALSLDVRENTGRISELEARSESLNTEIESMRADMLLAPKVGLLVEQLKDVAPKVIDQELCVRELLEKVGRLEVEDRMKTAAGGGEVERTAARMLRVEADVERLIATVDTLVKR